MKIEIMKKGKKHELEELEDGLMMSDSIKADSPEFKEAQAVMHNMIKKQSSKQVYKIEVLALEMEMEMKDYRDSQIKGVNELKKVQEFYKELLKVTEIKQNRLAKFLRIEPSNLGLMFRDGKVNYIIARKHVPDRLYSLARYSI